MADYRCFGVFRDFVGELPAGAASLVHSVDGSSGSLASERRTDEEAVLRVVLFLDDG